MVSIFLRWRSIEKTKTIFLIVTVVVYVTMIIVTICGIRRISEGIASEDIFACIMKKDTDALPALDASMMFPTNSIFFIESSCGYLSWREACSVESAARANPDRQINLFFTSSLSGGRFKNSIVSTLLSLPNVQVARIHVENYAEKTPLYNQLKQSLNEKDLNMELSDILKYLTMFKYSGTYLGLDVLVTNSFQKYQENWVVKRNNLKMSSDMFSFSSNKNGRRLAMLAFGILRSHFVMPEKYFGENVIMEKLLALWCGTTDPFNFVASNCEGLQIIGPNHLVPMLILKHRFLSKEEAEKWKDHKIYSYETWSRVQDSRKSLSKTIAEEYCPLVNVYYGYKIHM